MAEREHVYLRVAEGDVVRGLGTVITVGEGTATDITDAVEGLIFAGKNLHVWAEASGLGLEARALWTRALAKFREATNGQP